MLKNHDPIPQLVKDIKSVKIQGATQVAVAALTTLKKKIKLFPEMTKEELQNDIEKLRAARATEPMLFNALRFLDSRLSENGERENWQKEIIKSIDLFLARISDAGAEIVRQGVNLFHDKKVILTHCHSAGVEKIIIELAKRRDVKVFVTETRPLYQGKITADHLTRSGVSVIMIADSLAPNILKNGYEEKNNKLKVDAVLIGADAIDKKGSVAFNKVGSFSIADAAHEKHIPVYIVASLLKVSPEKVKIEVRPDREIWTRRSKEFDAYNPAFDKIPAKLIKGFLTEFGLVSEKKIEYLVNKYYPFIANTKLRKKNAEARKATSSSPYARYLHLGEKFDLTNRLVATYKLQVEESTDFFNTTGGIAAESSVGTWTSVKTEFKDIWEKLHARVFEADENRGILKIAYPLELFEPGNVAQLLSSVAGNIFGLKEVKKLRLLDLEMPEIYVQSFDGPEIGMEKIFKIAGSEGPLIGSIIKPKLGLNFKEHAKVAMEVFRAGGNLVKDDENLTSQEFNPFFDRVKLLTDEMKKFKYLQNPDGEKIYAFNVTAEAETMKERASFVKMSGGNSCMIDILTAGFSAVQFLRRQNFGLIIHGHRAMHAAFTRDVKEGVSMLVLAKLARLAGVDELHTGTIVGKMEGGKEVLEINNFLTREWFGLKKVLPVASGGLHPGLIPDLIKYLGKNMIFNFGGGIHGHPKGTYHGVKAVKESVEAVIHGEDWNKYVSTHPDLKIAMEKWGE